jgi:hypothetical protein
MVPMVEERDELRKIVKRYPLATKIGKNVFDRKPEFLDTKNLKICEKAYKLTVGLQSSRDLCEEYIAAQVWPLKKGWSFVCFHKKVVRGKDYLYPDKEAFRLKKYTKDEDFVSAVEVKVVEILGKFLKKEKDLMDKILGKDYKRVNRVFDIVQIKYDERPPPAYTRAAKPSIENVTKKKRASDQLAKRAIKKKKVSTFFDSEKNAEDEVDLGLDVDSEEVLSQQAHDDEVRMFSLVFNFSGLTPPMLTPLGDYFQNLASTFHFDENVGRGILSSP